jgi:hypothetical protein
MEAERFKNGLALRRTILGDAYVDAALKKATAPTQPFREPAIL